MRSRSGTIRDGKRASSAFSTRASTAASCRAPSLSTRGSLGAPHTMAAMTASPQVPEKPWLDGLEGEWAGVWEEQGPYRFDRSKARPDVYAIDTPPPTV